MNTNWITATLIAIGLIIVVAGALIEASRDFRNARNVETFTNAQLCESLRIANDADYVFSLEPAFRIVQAPPYNWQNDPDV